VIRQRISAEQIDTGMLAPLKTLMTIFATGFFAAIMPQGSSANIFFAGSSYMTTYEAYRNGAIVTLVKQ
jgi:DASS family divalent anion:Na+ symporter